MKPPESGAAGTSRDPEQHLVYERNIPALLHVAKLSELPLLPLSQPFLIPGTWK
jgi:hypothetical protein